ncbi:uncharacterized protein RHIMIDRAFT_291064 [Rhizopus microsporus ATCC 52813]|uniref:MULE transposase domain-containing protein n=1 Tax=Rhizopus microsporus ATCC 52813 TaxID=1340429 RepID=A0A2G4SWZ2_RHIZD|nr:uncharacterized protein RHIMIDRAFT_291064 [Rhizopus microsporus ATCC 52813]PHZ13300.1 hypothetical protein RHIMIDRAFT_291064 [Rhizopus microsporus ATCC 52813]
MQRLEGHTDRVYAVNFHPTEPILASCSADFTVKRQWLTWVKTNFSLNVKRIMIDCSSAETAAIRDVFEGSVQIFLCHWHIWRAWGSKLKAVARPKHTHGSQPKRKSIRACLGLLMGACSEEEFLNEEQFFAYFRTRWLVKKELFCKAWRPSASFHTNNLIESYHNQLKTFYLGRTRHSRCDFLINTLQETLMIGYRQETLKCLYGFQTVKLSPNDMKKKRLAYALDEGTATSMVQRSEDDDDMYDCKSFADDYIWYEIELKNGRLFPLLLVADVPYTLRSGIAVDTNTVSLSHEELAVTELADSIDKFENLYISDLRRKKLMYSLRRDKLEVINHAAKTSCYMMKEAAVIPQTFPERQS